ncbi:MAG: hypothetical protein ACTSQY_03865 [Candidatus Odinarchaeia archaeon]
MSIESIVSKANVKIKLDKIVSPKILIMLRKKVRESKTGIGAEGGIFSR